MQMGKPGQGTVQIKTVHATATGVRDPTPAEISPQSSYLAFSASGCGVAFGRGSLYFAGTLALPQPHWHAAAMTAAACRGVF
jgi:hypothetical protein